MSLLLVVILNGVFLLRRILFRRILSRRILLRRILFRSQNPMGSLLFRRILFRRILGRIGSGRVGLVGSGEVKPVGQSGRIASYRIKKGRVWESGASWVGLGWVGWGGERPTPPYPSQTSDLWFIWPIGYCSLAKVDAMMIEGIPEICRHRCSILIRDIRGQGWMFRGCSTSPPNEKSSNWNASPNEIIVTVCAIL
jgi:hypothetical protein